MAFARVVEHPLRAPLPAPVEGRNRKPALPELVHDLEIFLDHFGPAAEQANRPPPWSDRIPARITELQSVGGHEVPLHGTFGHRVRRNCIECHKALPLSVARSAS